MWKTKLYIWALPVSVICTDLSSCISGKSPVKFLEVAKVEKQKKILAQSWQDAYFYLFSIKISSQQNGAFQRSYSSMLRAMNAPPLIS